MALEFKEKSFTIEIYTGTNPIEDWLELHSELVTVLSLLDMQGLSIETPFRVLGLIRDMMPDWRTAKKMVE